MEGEAQEREALDQLTVLADELLMQAGEIRRQWAELAEMLGAEPETAGSPDDPGDGERAGDAESIRLVALDMMLSGSSREEVGGYLDATFGAEDREALLDDVFTTYD